MTEMEVCTQKPQEQHTITRHTLGRKSRGAGLGGKDKACTGPIAAGAPTRIYEKAAIAK